MVIFHSYVNVYQRVPLISPATWNFWRSPWRTCGVQSNKAASGSEARPRTWEGEGLRKVMHSRREILQEYHQWSFQEPIGLNWRYLPYIRPILAYMVQYLHFRILEFPLIPWFSHVFTFKIFKSRGNLWMSPSKMRYSMIFTNNPTNEIIIWLVYLPLWKMMDFVSWDDDIPFPIYGKS